MHAIESVFRLLANRQSGNVIIEIASLCNLTGIEMKVAETKGSTKF